MGGNCVKGKIDIRRTLELSVFQCTLIWQAQYTAGGLFQSPLIYVTLWGQKTSAAIQIPIGYAWLGPEMCSLKVRLFYMYVWPWTMLDLDTAES